MPLHLPPLLEAAAQFVCGGGPTSGTVIGKEVLSGSVKWIHSVAFADLLFRFPPWQTGFPGLVEEAFVAV